MNAEKILELAVAGNLNEIIRLCEGEICKQKLPNATARRLYNARMKLSRIASRMMSKLGREYLAGAYIIDNQQMICNLYWGVVYNDIFDGLVNVDENLSLQPNINDSVKTQSHTINDSFDADEIHNKLAIAKAKNKGFKGDYMIKVANKYYNAEYVLDILATLDDYVVYTPDGERGVSLIIKGKNGQGTVIGRKNINTENSTRLIII